MEQAYSVVSLKSASLLILLVGLASPSYLLAQDLRATGTVRTGVEWDDNVLRREGSAGDTDFLARYFTTVSVASRSMERGVAIFDISHGGKFFMTQAGSDELLTAIGLGYQYRVLEELGLFVNLDMKDRTERISVRDYNRGGLSGGADLFLGPVTLRLGAGGRYFAFKPSPDSSSSSVEAMARLRWEVIPNLYLGAGYTMAGRSFDTRRFVLDNDGVVMDSKVLREDRFHVAQVNASWRGPVVLEGAYALSINQSNSYGQQLTRQSVDLVATAPLMWNFFASLRVEIQRTAYDDPVLIDADFLLDEDNRNSLVGSLARTFGDSWEAEVRYSVYLQEFGVGSDYKRQTLMFAMGYLFE